MIGFYDYTVVLTYLSLLSAGTGIFVALSGNGHPYMGTFFLMFCGLCDAFDGMVANTKKNRTTMERNYGIQIDSLSDLVAFGVLPASIGMSLVRTSPFLQRLFSPSENNLKMCVQWALYAVLLLYILAAMIRLAYFNVTEEERQRTEGGKRRSYTGLPVTSVSLIFPLVMMFHYILPIDISIIYFPVALILGFLFLSKIHIPKPRLRGILTMIGIGLVECFLLLLFYLLFKK